MNRLCIPAMILLLCVSSGAIAQRKELIGVRNVSSGAADSNATYAIGLSLDNGATFVETARATDAVSISGIIRAEPGNVGQKANIYIVALANGTSWVMRNSAGVYVPWDGSVPALTPFLRDQTLTASFNVEIFVGTLGVLGTHSLFLGYLPADGILRYTPTAHRITITNQTIRDQAVAKFAASISNNIVQTSCIACHVNGGSADGVALNKFVTTANPSHLSTNFSQFENLVKARGRSLILSKVRGGNLHGGGAILLQGSTDYTNLDQFLLLLEKL